MHFYFVVAPGPPGENIKALSQYRLGTGPWVHSEGVHSPPFEHENRTRQACNACPSSGKTHDGGQGRPSTLAMPYPRRETAGRGIF